MRIGISGGHGKMGTECARIFVDAGETIAFSVDRNARDGEYRLFSDVPENAVCDCIVDFSSPSVLAGLLEFAKARKCAAVIATTGFTVSQTEEIALAAREVPIFTGRNMSVGVNIIGRLCEILAGALSPAYDAEIVEIHHASKRDAPSGTALYLADRIKRGFGGGEFVFDRRVNEQRKPMEIGIHSLRGGSVVGRHTVGFFGMGESISIAHYAEDRALFAHGALAAAHFLCGREARLYGMDDLVNELISEKSPPLK